MISNGVMEKNNIHTKFEYSELSHNLNLNHSKVLYKISFITMFPKLMNKLDV